MEEIHFKMALQIGRALMDRKVKYNITKDAETIAVNIEHFMKC